MEAVSDKDFYSAILTAGSILMGFSGTFLQFRIQREANYHRQPALSYEEGKARDVVIGLSHFTSAFLLIICAVTLEVIFGFFLPLLALTDPTVSFISHRLVAAGLMAALIFVVGYFCAELVHYRILSTRLLHDKKEWGRQWLLVIGTFSLALIVGALFAVLA